MAPLEEEKSSEELQDPWGGQFGEEDNKQRLENEVIYLSIYLSTYLFIYLSIYLSFHLSIYVSICLPIFVARSLPPPLL